MRRILATAVLLGATGFAANAAADGHTGPYASISGGINFLDDSDFDVLGTVDVDNEYDTGFVVAGAIGNNYGEIWSLGSVRTELELSYRENDIDVHDVTALGGELPGSTGEASTTALMVNVFNDFHNDTAFTPYLGAGIGYAWSDLDDYGVAAIPSVLDDDDSGFAWQLIAGVSYAVNDAVSLTADYRYFNADADVTSTPGTGSTSSDVDLDSHVIQFGLRYSF